MSELSMSVSARAGPPLPSNSQSWPSRSNTTRPSRATSKASAVPSETRIEMVSFGESAGEGGGVAGIDEDLADVLETADGELFGTAERQKVGGTWPVRSEHLRTRRSTPVGRR